MADENAETSELADGFEGGHAAEVDGGGRDGADDDDDQAGGGGQFGGVGLQRVHDGDVGAAVEQLALKEKRGFGVFDGYDGSAMAEARGAVGGGDGGQNR